MGTTKTVTVSQRDLVLASLLRGVGKDATPAKQYNDRRLVGARSK